MHFSDYLAQTRFLIQKTRPDLQSPLADHILAANMPFEWRPKDYDGKKGILLVHGLLDSPFSVHDLGHFFYQQGFLVRSILLPGHGTVPEALLTVDYQEWLATVAFGLDSFNQESDQTYYLGISTGALLGLNQAIQEKKLAGLFLISPACQLTPFSQVGVYFFRLLQLMLKKQSWSAQLRKTVDYAKYTRFPVNAAWQVERLIRATMPLAFKKNLNTPVFMAVSADDEVVNPQIALRYFLSQSHPRSRCVFYSNRSVKLADQRIVVLSSAHTEDKIVDFSHICLHISPDNPHWGRHGDNPQETQGDPHQAFYQGSLSSQRKYPAFRRLSYNPYFDQLLEQIKLFL